MLPFSMISKIGSVPSENTIITVLKQGGTLTNTNVTVSPTSDFKTASYNAIRFNTGSANIQVGTSGIPSIWQIGNSTNFKIETYVKLTNTQTKILCGNLNNNGTGSWWLVLNNTFQSACAVALDGIMSNGTAQRFHFTSMQTLTANVWHYIVLQRVGTTLTCTVDGSSIGSFTMNTGFQAQNNPFRVGDSTDNAYPFNGVIDSFKITMN